MSASERARNREYEKREARAEEVLSICRQAICSIGTWDMRLQDHYQAKLDKALAHIEGVRHHERM